MRRFNIFVVVFWIASVAAPLVACALSSLQMPDIVKVPLHWNVYGEADRWGSPAEFVGALYFLGAIMSVSNFVMALCYVFNDRLYDAGFVHGVTRGGALKVYVALATFLVVLAAAIAFGVSAKIAAAV